MPELKKKKSKITVAEHVILTEKLLEILDILEGKNEAIVVDWNTILGNKKIRIKIETI